MGGAADRWSKSAGLLFIVASLSLGRPQAQADDFDDDFAAPAPAPAAPAPAAPAPAAPEHDFEDDFASEPTPAPPAPAAPAAPAAKGPRAAGSASGAAASSGASTGAKAGARAGADDGIQRVDDGVIDPFEDDYDAGNEDEKRRRQLLRSHNTYLGPVGGIRVVDAGGGADESFRFALSTEFFTKNGFMAANDDHSRVGGALTFSITPFPYLEFAASIVAYASANQAEDPPLFQVLGDTRLFAKGFTNVLPWLTVGGDMELALLNGVGGVGFSGSGTSLGLRANASTDLRMLAKPLPLIFRTNIRYYFDNSAKLIEDVEQARYNNLINPLPQSDEHRHLVSRIERYAFTVNRVDTLSMAVGAEVPLRVKGNFYMHPIAEWQFALPVNRQDYNCVYRPFDPTEADSCLAEEGFAARPSIVTIGMRFLPPIRGLSFLTAFDIGAAGKKTFVRELAPTSRWMWLNGLSYAYDLRPPKPVIVHREVPVEVRVAQGRIRGRVVEVEAAGESASEDTGEAAVAVAGATIRFEDPTLSAVLSGDDGSFVSYGFPPGPQTMQLTSDEHEPATCEASLLDGGADVEVSCSMVALPKLGTAKITVRDDDGGLDGARMRIDGPSSRTVMTNSAGGAAIEDLPPGSYHVELEADGYLARRVSFEVSARETTTLDVAVAKKPKTSLVRLSAKRISIKRQVQFKPNASEIKAQSHALMSQIADVLLRHSEIRQIEIQGHTDNSGRRERNKTLSQDRAEAVRTWLIEAGVEAERMTAVGYGDSKPIVPNITPSNRARNRRVQFVISERDETPDGE